MKILYFPISPKNLKYIIIISLAFFSWQITLSQTRIMSGCLVDNNNEPIPGVNIILKGTNTGTVTDINGCYEIKCDLGDVLMFSFIGFLNEEVTVTDKNSRAIEGYSGKKLPVFNKTKAIPQVSSFEDKPKILDYFLEKEVEDSIKDKKLNISEFSTNSKSYIEKLPETITYNYFQNRNNTLVLTNINEGGKYKFNYANKQKYIRLPHVSYAFSIGQNEAYKFPSLQKVFSQGRPVNGSWIWYGPETGEVFSWGPKLSSLKYDGLQYNFDRNGSFANKNTNDDISPSYNDPLDFFQKNISIKQKISIYYNNNETNAELKYFNSRGSGLFRGSEKNENGITSHLSRRFFGWFTPGIDLKISNQKDKLMTEGPWQGKVMQSLLLTPPGFDLYNGFEPSNKKLYQQENLFISDGVTQRSFAPAHFETPYWLVQNAIDEGNFQRFFLNPSLKFNAGEFTATLNAFADKQIDESIYGIPENSLFPVFSRYSVRNEEYTSELAHLTMQYSKFIGNVNWKIIANANIGQDKKTLSINESENKNTTDKNITTNKYSASRKWNSSGLKGEINYEEIIGLNLDNSLYFSNTLKNNKKGLYNWSLGSYFNISRIDNFYNYPVNLLKIRFQFVNSQNEHDFRSPFKYHNSLFYNSYEFENIYRNDYLSLFDPNPLNAEKHKNLNFGLDIGLFNNKIDANFEVFSNRAKDLIVLVWQNDNYPVLENAIDLKSTGTEIDLSFYYFNYYDIRGQFKISFSTLNQEVTDIHSDNSTTYLPIGGFNDVFTAAVPNQEYGVIMGSSYLRNSSGKLIIGTDGYPIPQYEPRVIGNPNPDFILGIYNSIRYRFFTLDFLFDIKKGGQKWNGTLNTLKYYGVSQSTIRERETTNFIYDGINLETGNVNTQQVDFASPESEVTEFRSVRNGVSGIAEDAIVDASWVRLKNISLNYKIDYGFIQRIYFSELNITASILNALIITKYDGVDPETTLFGMDITSGLDYFNIPNTRTYELKIGFTF